MDTRLIIAIVLLLVMNVSAFVVMGIDKFLAISHKWRIPEKTLFAFAIAFGGIGGFLGMRVFRHKTRHWYFAVFFPILAVLQVIVIGLALYYFRDVIL